MGGGGSGVVPGGGGGGLGTFRIFGREINDQRSFAIPYRYQPSTIAIPALYHDDTIGLCEVLFISSVAAHIAYRARLITLDTQPKV